MGFSSGVLGFSSGAFGCIFSSWALALVSWAWALALESWAFARGGAFSFSMQPESLWGFSSSAVLGFSREVLAFRSWGFGFSSASPQSIFSSGAFRSRVWDFSSGVLGLGLSSGVLRFSSGVLGFSLGSWALALGSWALTLGFRLWGLRLFSSGASALSLL